MTDYGLHSANEILRIARLLRDRKHLTLTQLDKVLAEADKLEAHAIDNMNYMQEIMEYNGQIAQQEGTEKLHNDHKLGWTA